MVLKGINSRYSFIKKRYFLKDLYIPKIQKTFVDKNKLFCKLKYQLIFSLELDKHLSRPPNYDYEAGQVIKYGAEPPERVALDDLCPPPVICPSCTRPIQNKLNCKNDLFSVQELLNHRDLEIHILDNYPGMGTRELSKSYGF